MNFSTWQQILVYYLVATNAVAFIIFGLDKYFAKIKTRRIPEKTLWLITIIGGSLGAIIGMEAWKHKRRKASFVFVMAIILLLQAFLIALLLGWPEL